MRKGHPARDGPKTCRYKQHGEPHYKSTSASGANSVDTASSSRALIHTAAAVVGIVAQIGLAAVKRIAVAIGEAGIAGDLARAIDADGGAIVRRAHIPADSAVIHITICVAADTATALLSWLTTNSPAAYPSGRTLGYADAISALLARCALHTNRRRHCLATRRTPCVVRLQTEPLRFWRSQSIHDRSG